MRKIVACLVVVVLLVSSFSHPLKAQGDCYVPSEYGTIQDAVNDPGCTTIYVAAGTYTETLININRPLNLAGTWGDPPTLNGRIDVHSGPVNVSRFTIIDTVEDTCAIFYDHSSGNVTGSNIVAPLGVCYENGSGNVERNTIDSEVGVVYYPDLSDGPTAISGNVRNNDIYAGIAGVVYALASGTVEGNTIDAMVGVASVGSDIVVRNNPDIYALAGVVYLLSKGSIEGNTIDAEIGVASAVSCTLGDFSMMSPYSFECTAGSVDVSGNEIESEAGIVYIASTGSIEGNQVDGDLLGVASVLSGLVESFSYDEGTGSLAMSFSPGNVSIIENQVYGDEGFAGIFDVHGLGDIEGNHVEGYTGSSSPLGPMGFGILTAVVPNVAAFSPEQSTTLSLLALPEDAEGSSVASELDGLFAQIMEVVHMEEFPIPALSELERLSLVETGHVAFTQALQQNGDGFGINIEGNTVVGNWTGIEVFGFPTPIELPLESFPITITRNLVTGNETHGIEAYFGELVLGIQSLNEARQEGTTPSYSTNVGATALQQGDEFPLIVTDNVCTLNGFDGISFTWPFEGYIINNTLAYNTQDGIDVDCLSSCYIINNISTFNGSKLGDGGIEVDASIEIEDYNDVWGNFENYRGIIPGIHDISLDPRFVSPTGDLHLTCISPAINAGDNSAPEIPDVDFDGEARIQDGMVDMGAYEGCSETPVSEKNPIPSLLPTAVNHISEGGTLLEQADDLLSETKSKNLDTDQCEKLIDEATELLDKAKKSLTNPIYANNLALQAIEKLKKAIDCLKALLG